MDKRTCDDLGRLKTLLMTIAGLAQDSLASSQIFMTRTWYPEEKVSMELKRLFKDAYWSDYYTSAILLQRFLTGLLSPIHHQLLLHGKPETLHQAIKDAVNVEYDTGLEDTQEFNVVQSKPPAQDSSVAHKLQESLDQIVKINVWKLWRPSGSRHQYKPHNNIPSLTVTNQTVTAELWFWAKVLTLWWT